MKNKILVLDNGYVEHIESWGAGREGIPGNDWDGSRPDFEVGIVEAARQSTQGNFRGWEKDKLLLKHLYSNKHETPFEFAGMIIEVQAPIFVFREWHRHRTQSYNEMSARYTPLPDLYYHPSLSNVVERAQRARLTKNKQEGAMNVAAVNGDDIKAWLNDDRFLQATFEKHYQEGLALGIPKELARNSMPVGHYSRMRASANLRNWLAFLTLRLDPLAQWEIRQFAEAVGSIIADQFPQTWDLFAHEEIH